MSMSGNTRAPVSQPAPQCWLPYCYITHSQPAWYSTCSWRECWCNLWPPDTQKLQSWDITEVATCSFARKMEASCIIISSTTYDFFFFWSLTSEIFRGFFSDVRDSCACLSFGFLKIVLGLKKMNLRKLGQRGFGSKTVLPLTNVHSVRRSRRPLR